VPTSLDLQSGSDSGALPDDNVTKDDTPLFGGGETESGVTIELYADGVLVGTGSASGGFFTVIATTPVANGEIEFTVKALDAAGNRSDASDAEIVLIDTVAPAPTITSPASGGTVTTLTPTTSGDAGNLFDDSNNLLLDVYSGASVNPGSIAQSLTVARTGAAWSKALDGGLSQGEYTVQVNQEDLAGNIGTSAPLTFTIAL
jgi:hypothetical protein